jgi:hypothetical protein
MLGQGSLNRLALSATVHRLTGCAIGEVLGMIERGHAVIHVHHGHGAQVP